MGRGSERHTARLATVSFVTHEGRVLLLRHPEDGDRFRGRWNGIGGHVEAGEDVCAAARRELREEAGLDVPDLVLRGVVHEAGLLGHAYVLFVFAGSVRDADVHAAEGHELRWQPLAELGALPLVHDVAVLLPRALAAGAPFTATERYDGGDRRTHLAFDARPDPPEAEAARVG